MMISKQHLERLKGMLHETPLETGKLRRVTWAGEQYIAHAETHVSSAEYTYLYEITIEGVRYRFYAKNTIRPPQAG